jgi:dihydrofolate reductase
VELEPTPVGVGQLAERVLAAGARGPRGCLFTLASSRRSSASCTEPTIRYVISSTLEYPGWNNSVVLKGDVADEVSKLKQEIDGETVVYASFHLLRTLMKQDLVDELRLMVYPIILGAGEGLFGETSDKQLMRLVDVRTIAGDLAFLTDEPVRDA